MFVADLVLVVAMVSASAFGALALPPNGMLPVDLGVGSGLSWMPKGIGLVLWPALGVGSYFLFRLAGAFGQMGPKSLVGLTIALALMLLAQSGSILVAINRRGRP
jgi:hypothetical protein